MKQRRLLVDTLDFLITASVQAANRSDGILSGVWFFVEPHCDAA
jgi:hypothetical protein